ncbi:MAG: lysophospholipid acyltransferase family protein [Micrococcus sp.]|nr:lysophospholipid acyltransferase family protein [Micrococcus sp.]
MTVARIDSSDVPQGPPSRGTKLGYGLTAAVVRPSMRAIVRQDWQDTHKIPRTGAILAMNHIAEIDPVSVAHMVYNQGLLPTFLAKAELWKIPVVGSIMRGTRMIPVQRTNDAGRSLAAAKAVLGHGGVIMVYPEGTVTRDPERWPMTARTGAVRLALQTGAPLIPVGQWGIHELMPYPSHSLKPFPRKTAHVRVGDPVELADLRDKPMTATVLREGTERMMADITAIVADLRGEAAPQGRWDLQRGERI